MAAQDLLMAPIAEETRGTPVLDRQHRSRLFDILIRNKDETFVEEAKEQLLVERKQKQKIDGKEVEVMVTEIDRSVMGYLTGVLGALVALPFTLVRIALTRAQNATAAEVMITERLSKAVELLGNTDTAVRMGAIYLLDRLMVDSAVDRVMVLETLNAYLKYRRAIDAAESAEQVMDMDIDVQAALDVILKWTDRSR